jgi:hypothetical protein
MWMPRDAAVLVAVSLERYDASLQGPGRGIREQEGEQRQGGLVVAGELVVAGGRARAGSGEPCSADPAAWRLPPLRWLQCLIYSTLKDTHPRSLRSGTAAECKPQTWRSSGVSTPLKLFSGCAQTT